MIAVGCRGEDDGAGIGGDGDVIAAVGAGDVSGGNIAGSEGVLRMPGGGNDENLEGDLGGNGRAEDHRVVHGVGYVVRRQGC